ncbi:Enoyl-[acyl-carrier-protein] reductase [NADPH] FabL [Rubripirellula amarantea]|uniref:Enoyl-[acyl-carrier-protein] reductase [NADPH] FabL n=1 Tax=Rubripirellula amarantea TaxID=2527999 RepID=A0A5C5WG97_9BACT|nr:SDR family oxidoreductase [Rubripirellula amarantea]TWT49680.1 Enoyl-[acyl-carrier-protein] reductase [NADPH] FabL [Rubripirellula amarantea]
MTSQNNPVAIVTGGATGVGRACVLQLAKRGFDVFLNYSRSESDALQTASDAGAFGTTITPVKCDVSQDAEVRAMLDRLRQQHGRLDVVVNNAAMTDFVPYSDLEGLTEAKWDRVLAVNLKGTFFVSRAAAELLTAGQGGAIVNVSSVAAITGMGSSIAYAASKAGVNSMTKSLAKTLAPKVRVNAVCPGPIDSRWIREGIPGWSIDEMVADYPIPKPSSPDDIADAVIFFALGTSMTTGQILSVDGGQTL